MSIRQIDLNGNFQIRKIILLSLLSVFLKRELWVNAV
jgi:hypothetical protein